MKTAIVLTGHMRCWQQVFPNFKERIIDRYKNPDIFIHTWKDEAWWAPQEGAKGFVEGTPNIDIQGVKAHYNPVEMVVEDFDEYLPIFESRTGDFPNFYHRPKNIMSMFYKIGAGLNLLENHVLKTGTEYDLVIRMRPDMILHDYLPAFDLNKFYTLAHRNHMGGGTGDMFQIGSLENVSKFSRIGLELGSLYRDTDLLCPHVLSQHYISKYQMPWQEFMVNKTLQHTPAGQYQAVRV
jgi:hypothetical protein